MERKPWSGNGPRGGFGRSDRFDRFDRFERPRFDKDRDERGAGGRRFDRFDRFERGDRSERLDRMERSDRFERRTFDRDGRDVGSYRAKPQGGRGFGGKQNRERAPEFGVRSGPRARAFETRRYAERSDFAKNAAVKIDADIADFFGSPEAVNKALRLLVEAARCVKFPVKKVETETVAPETAAAIFGPEGLEDDDSELYGKGEGDIDGDEDDLDEISFPEDEEEPKVAEDASCAEEKPTK